MSGVSRSEQADMRRAKRVFLMRVFDALGPAVVRRGLAATGHTWSSGFLRHACGKLPEEALPVPTKALRAGPFFAAWLGIAPGWVYAIADLWDRDEADFRAVAEAWLGANALAGPNEPRGEVGSRAGGPGAGRPR